MVVILVLTAMSMNSDSNFDFNYLLLTATFYNAMNVFSGFPYIEYLTECTCLYCMGSPQGYNI